MRAVLTSAQDGGKVPDAGLLGVFTDPAGACDTPTRAARQPPKAPALHDESVTERCALTCVWERASIGSRPLTAPVAQLDRAPDYESGGQEFESSPVRHSKPL